ncbi:MAG: GGDEF domain-containing protein, partial [Spirochaetaceae bacterium]|nr:GGDEF domain-containing protein [Spirochaetaceae bacterium]
VITDVLTGASSRRALESALPRMLYRSKRRGTDLSLLVVDMDHFKEVNDQYGRQDRVLQSFAGIVSDTIRSEDLLVRLGGDEFLIATETDADGAMRIARDIVSAFGKAEPRVTLSCGIASAVDGDSPENVVKKLMRPCTGRNPKAVIESSCTIKVNNRRNLQRLIILVLPNTPGAL